MNPNGQILYNLLMDKLKENGCLPEKQMSGNLHTLSQMIVKSIKSVCERIQ